MDLSWLRSIFGQDFDERKKIVLNLSSLTDQMHSRNDHVSGNLFHTTKEYVFENRTFVAFEWHFFWYEKK